MRDVLPTSLLPTKSTLNSTSLHAGRCHIPEQHSAKRERVMEVMRCSIQIQHVACQWQHVFQCNLNCGLIDYIYYK
jgi:hypothetical protein